MSGGWIKNVLSVILPEAVNRGAQVFEKKVKAKLTDVAEEVPFVEEARKRSLDLLSVLRKGGGRMGRLRLLLSTRKKVRKKIAGFYDLSEIVDEVTEKIVETSEEDPYFRKLFG